MTRSLPLTHVIGPEKASRSRGATGGAVRTPKDDKPRHLFRREREFWTFMLGVFFALAFTVGGVSALWSFYVLPFQANHIAAKGPSE